MSNNNQNNKPVQAHLLQQQASKLVNQLNQVFPEKDNKQIFEI